MVSDPEEDEEGEIGACMTKSSTGSFLASSSEVSDMSDIDNNKVSSLYSGQIRQLALNMPRPASSS